MWSAAFMNDLDLQRSILDARDIRQARLSRALEGGERWASVLTISANIPGKDKHRPGVSRLVERALSSLHVLVGLTPLVSEWDVLGPFHIAGSQVSPEVAKRTAMVIEADALASRLLDVDVYRPNGDPVCREDLGEPPRCCLVCGEPARECILLKRHPIVEMQMRVDSLLRPFAALPRYIDPEALAVSMVEGALQELDLSPKPGLVDRLDNGSHPDLSYAAMRTSAGLLAVYYDDILRCHKAGHPLSSFVQVGLNAESRMYDAIKTNGHKGYIFLSGLLLMATCECHGQVEGLRKSVSEIASRFFCQEASTPLRRWQGIGGIRTEAERGLPSVFEHGWPRYREAKAMGWTSEKAGFLLMGLLMQQVEDTTAVRRCGLTGLTRLRRDGVHLQTLLERYEDPRPLLTALNVEYQAMSLTMGGVADCLGLTLALQQATT